MDFVVFVIAALIFTLQCMGTLSGNILAGKASLQSSTWENSSLCPSSGNNSWLCYSHYALDGNMGIPSITKRQSNPYWQADLGGFFNVTEITVTSINDFETKLDDAIIEVSTTSLTTCSELGSTITFGRWPGRQQRGVSITFKCSLSTAVRYVRIRREITYYLAIAEIEAEGVPYMFPGQQYYSKIESKKVTTPVKSLSVTRVMECGTLCQNTQPCIAFSFSKDKRQNCLLASDTTMTTDAEWIGYTVTECIIVPTICLPNCLPIR